MTQVHKRKSLKKPPPLDQGTTLREPVQVIGDQAVVEAGTFAQRRCECGAMMHAGVDHSCQGPRPRKRFSWEYSGGPRSKPDQAARR